MKLNEKLHVYWSDRDQDLMFHSPLGLGTVTDGRFLSGVLTSEVVEELDRRGYDTRTIKFSIEPQATHPKFSATRPEGMTADEAWAKLREGVK